VRSRRSPASTQKGVQAAGKANNEAMLHVLLSADQWAEIEAYRAKTGKRSRKAAVRELLALGLKASTNSA
jgi:hypothetical protein